MTSGASVSSGDMLAHSAIQECDWPCRCRGARRRRALARRRRAPTGSDQRCADNRRFNQKFITRQPPKGEKDDYDSGKSRRRRGEGRGEGREKREKMSASEVDVGFDGARNKTQVERR